VQLGLSPGVVEWGMERAEGGHLVGDAPATALDARIELPSVGISLALAEIYDGLGSEAAA
jgi:hypothetical protein